MAHTEDDDHVIYVDVHIVNEHIKKIYLDSELEKDSTIRNFRIVQTEGSRQVTRQEINFQNRKYVYWNILLRRI